MGLRWYTALFRTPANHFQAADTQQLELTDLQCSDELRYKFKAGDFLCFYVSFQSQISEIAAEGYSLSKNLPSSTSLPTNDAK
jgi:hypothetical protein